MESPVKIKKFYRAGKKGHQGGNRAEQERRKAIDGEIKEVESA